MKAEDVVRQLFAVLPKYTGLFSDEVPIDSITSVGSTATVTTSIAHGLSTGNYVNILNALAPIPVTSLVRTIAVESITRSGNRAIVKTVEPHNLPQNTGLTISGADQVEYNINTEIFVIDNSNFFYYVSGSPTTPATGTIIATLDDIAIAETSANHDLTMSERVDGTPLTVVMSGADQAEYNGTHELLAVPNRRKFLYRISGSPATPATGTIFLLENKNINSFNGRFEVTVVDPNTFTYQLVVPITTTVQGSPILRCRHRMSRAERLERINASYTRQPPTNYWCWVVLDNAIMSKSRETTTDATARPDSWLGFRQHRIEQFSVFVIAPTTNEIAAASVRDSMEDVGRYLFKSLMGVKFPTVYSANTHNGCVNVGEANITENTAYYVHQYIFESTIDITACDIIEPQDSVAFRDIDIDFGVDFYNANDIVTRAEIDLDDVRL